MAPQKNNHKRDLTCQQQHEQTDEDVADGAKEHHTNGHKHTLVTNEFTVHMPTPTPCTSPIIVPKMQTKRKRFRNVLRDAMQTPAHCTHDNAKTQADADVNMNAVYARHGLGGGIPSKMQDRL